MGAWRAWAIARAEVYFSPLSAWELGLKILAGRLDLGGRSPIADWLAEGFTELPFSATHAEAALELPPIHRDPVDRCLVAQALVDGLTLATDDDLNIVAAGPDLVAHQPPEAMANMDPVVVKMHTSSGLLDAIAESTVTLEEAGTATLDFIRTHAPKARTVPLCGNTIGTDRRCLAAYLSVG